MNEVNRPSKTLVQRLRENDTRSDRREAADEIERLQREVETLGDFIAANARTIADAGVAHEPRAAHGFMVYGGELVECGEPASEPPSDQQLRDMLIRCRDSTIPHALRYDIDKLLGPSVTKSAESP